jgi:hypothetical protein
MMERCGLIFEDAPLESGPRIQAFDVVEHEGLRWLVPEWIDRPELGKSQPIRLICLSLLQHQKSSSPDYCFLLTLPMPKAVFFQGRGGIQKGVLYRVIERPELFVDKPSLLQ